MNRKILNLIVILSVCAGSVHGQTLRAFLEAGENAITDKNYYAAQYYLGEALQFDTSDVDITYQYAEVLNQFNSYSQAEQQYLSVLELDDDNAYPMTTYELGRMQQQLGKYEEAQQNYELFISEYTGETDYLIKANNAILQLKWVMEQEQIQSMDAEVERLTDEINTSYSEFGGNYFNDDFYYSSLRFETLEDEFEPNRIFSKILKADDDESIGEVIENGEINSSPLHVAHSTFSPEGDLMIYTICDYQSANDIRCDLYSRTITDSIYGPEIKLPGYINDPNHTSTQPQITTEADSEDLIIYFASDRPHPTGKDYGLDIYKMKMYADGTFTEPENVSDVNSMGDEVTPYYDRWNGILYFSSNSGMGYGGFDVFKSLANGDGFQERVNLGKGINSSYNDLYYVSNPEGTEAYFSSNRLGSNYIDELAEACCYDIYRAEIEDVEIKLDALTFNKQTLDELNGATVKLYDAVTGELIDEITVMENNIHTFDIESSREYMLVGSKNGYTSDTLSFSTHGATELEMTKKLFLESTGPPSPFDNPDCIKMTLSTFEKLAGAPLNGVSIVIEDLSSNPSEPMKLLDINGNQYVVCLEPDKEYKVIATKPGYEPTSIMVDTRGLNPGESLDKSIYLQKQVPNLVTKLPVELYFDNDQPDSKTIRMHTLKTYTDTYYPYIAREEVFKQNRANRMSSASDKQAAVARIESFFAVEVRGGYSQLKDFLNLLTTRLQAGETYQLEIQGYTSPLASNQYNKALGQRRVFSIKNELKAYNGGVLAAFIDNGQLKIKDTSFGEDLAPAGISDQPTDKPNSIYSVEASKERRATIVDITKLN